MSSKNSPSSDSKVEESLKVESSTEENSTDQVENSTDQTETPTGKTSDIPKSIKIKKNPKATEDTPPVKKAKKSSKSAEDGSSKRVKKSSKPTEETSPSKKVRKPKLGDESSPESSPTHRKTIKVDDDEDEGPISIAKTKTPPLDVAPQEEKLSSSPPEEENMDFVYAKKPEQRAPTPISISSSAKIVKVKIAKKAKMQVVEDLWTKDAPQESSVKKRVPRGKLDMNDVHNSGYRQGRNFRMIHEKKWYFKLKKSDDDDNEKPTKTSPDKEEKQPSSKDEIKSDALAVAPEKKRQPKNSSLLDENPIETLSGKLIICLKVKNTQIAKATTGKQLEELHYFAVFKDFIEFSTYRQKIPPNDWCFYEVILANTFRKPYFDIDIDQALIDELLQKEENVSGKKASPKDDDTETLSDDIPTDVSDGQDFPEEDYYDDDDFRNILSSHTHLGNYILSKVITNTVKIFKKKGIILKTETDILVYQSHRTGKTSYHLVINNYCHQNNIEAKQLYNKVVKYVKRDIKSETKNSDAEIKSIISLLPYQKIIDNSVYSRTQQFRTVESHKPGTSFTKKFIKSLNLPDLQIDHKYVEEPDDLDHETVIILDESLVTNTNSCTILPPFSGKNTYAEYKQNNRAIVSADVTKEMARFAINMLATNSGITAEDRRFPFKIQSISGGLVLLKRTKPSRCSLCSRVHDSENPYLIIGGDGNAMKRPVYYHCRRAPVSQKKYLGDIDNEDFKSKLEEWAQSKIVGEVLEIKTDDPWLNSHFKDTTEETTKVDKKAEELLIAAEEVEEDESDDDCSMDYVIVKSSNKTIDKVIEVASMNITTGRQNIPKMQPTNEETSAVFRKAMSG
jgi:hypothetical protein